MIFLIQREKTILREDKFVGKIFTAHRDDIELENGEKAFREVVDHPGGVCVAAITEKNEILLVKQFRYPYMEVCTEVPAGKLEKGEDPFEAVKREQLEETGTGCEKYISLGNLYPSPGYCGEIIRMWAGRISWAKEQKLDEGEFLDVEKVPVEEAFKMVMSGEIKDSKTQVAILKVRELIKDGKL